VKPLSGLRYSAQSYSVLDFEAAMSDPAWARFVGFLGARREQRRGGTLRRPVRLHAERLEDRMLMSASRPAPALEAELPGPEMHVARTIDAADSPTAAGLPAKADVKSTVSSVKAPWERFRSREELKAWLLQAALDEYGHLFGQSAYGLPSWDYWRGPIFEIGIPVLRTAEFTLAASSDAGASSTNLQVEGVDEADLVETDGKFIYIVSGQELVIVSAGEGDDLKIMSRVHLDERPDGIYLSGNRLAIISSNNDDWLYSSIRAFPLIAIDAVIDVATVNGDVAGGFHRPTTTVTVLDITDRAAPTLVQKTELDGRLVSSRTVDGELRLVLSNDFRLPPPVTKPGEPQHALDPESDFLAPGRDTLTLFATTDLWRPRWYGYEDSYVYETLDEYVSRVGDDLLDSFDARIRSLLADGSVVSDSALADATEIYRPDDLSARSLTTIMTFDLHSNQSGPADKVSVLTNGPAEIYATGENIYVFGASGPQRDSLGGIDWNQSPSTSVWKFSTDARTHTVELAARGQFSGLLLNQFAADEHDGYLRVVSYTDAWNSAGQSVYVLQQTGRRLNVVGSVTGVALNETLHSVRFLGDKLFFVTFRQIDPLFAVDLSDPTRPVIMGELHIPGYSEYLQPIDESHLLGIGRDVAPWFPGGAEEPDSLQISIFDVSDLTSPLLTDRYTFGGGFSTVTPATGNRLFGGGDGDHHAVSYFADEQILALPIQSESAWWGAESGPLFDPGEGGLQIFRIDVDTGFTPIALIEHDTPIERSLRIGDRLYAISSGELSVHDMADPNMQLGELDLGATGLQLVELKMYEAPVPVAPVMLAPVVKPAPATSPQPGWVLHSQDSRPRTQPARGAAFREFRAVRQIDDASLQLLAADVSPEDSELDSDDQNTFSAAKQHRSDEPAGLSRSRATSLGQHSRSAFSSVLANDSIC
jgi:hypothetical protein